ncbi:hypothetical protein Ahy_B04g072714 [Arachis hypogaea]|uniref:SWIM-type domain-containing protein n=1 Tax=Arachis hypogaea TaxID=3818 RepID=A0A444ZNU2_ARAHY|nr:hypothetical protein Ahy_B04g072714 [Arachis hypogaea]
MKKQSTSTQVCPIQFSSPHTSNTSSRVIAGRGCKVVGRLLLLVLHERSHLWSGNREVSFDKVCTRKKFCLPLRMSYFSVKVYHHGSFGLEGGILKYLGGETTVIDYCNEDEWSLIEVYNIVSRQGYLKKDIAAMWYKSLDQSTEDGLRMLRTDKDAMDMANIGVRKDMVELKTSGGDSGPNVEEENVGEKDGKDESDEEEEGSDGSEDEDYTPKGGVDDSSDSWSSDSRNGYYSEDSAAEIMFGDSDDEKEGAEGLVDVNIRVGDTFEAGTTETQTDATKESRSDNDRGKEKIVAGLGDEEEGYESEDFLDVPIVGDDEDDNNVAKRYPLHKQLKDMSEYKWEIGTLYVSREEFKDCATAYAVHTRRGLRFDKVDLQRVKVTCVEGCNLFAYYGKMKNGQTWQLTSCHNKHSCSRELKIGIMHAKWLSKGLVPTFDELIPGVDHRFCVRHLYRNFRNRFLGLQLKLMMWNAVKATYLQEWERRMAEIQSVDNGAYNHLMEIPTKYWCRHKFGTWSKCDTLVNNMCEVFNSVIVDAREKPIVSMLEDIRVYIMRRWADNRDRIIEYPREVLPRIRIKVEKQADASGKWVSTYAGRDKYEVTSIQGGKEKFVVDLKNHECSCRKFQLSGIPCAHAMTCIKKMCFNVDKFVANCYKKATYTDCYQHVVYPLNGPNLWEKTPFDDVLPPIYRKPIGRPKLKRNKAADENPTRGGVSREGQNQKCSYCFARCHNKRTCPKKRKVAATASANKVAGSTRRASRIISSTSTISSTISSRGSKQSQAASKKTTVTRPKRKSSATDVSSQHSQAISKKAKLTPSTTNLRVLPSPSKNISKSH